MRIFCVLACVGLFAGPALAQVKTVEAKYTLEPGDCDRTVQLGTGSTGPFTLTIPPASDFGPNCRVVVANADIGRGKFLAGAPVLSYDLPPLLLPRQSFAIQGNGSEWIITKAPGRWLVPAGTTFYLDAAQGSDTNDGLAPGGGNAWRTTLHAVRVLKQSVDFGLTWNGPINVAFADSIYEVSNGSGLWVNGPFLGAATDDAGINERSCPVVFRGNAQDPSKVVVSSTTGDAVTGIGGTFFCIQDMKLSGDSSDLAAGGASVIRFGNVILGASHGAKVRSGHGSAIENYPDSTIRLAGDSSSVFWGLVNGNVYITRAKIIVDSDLAVKQFALAESGGGLYYKSNSVDGRGVIAGAKFNANSAGYIYTGTNDVDLLPGTRPGELNGGVYDEFGLPTFGKSR